MTRGFTATYGVGSVFSLRRLVLQRWLHQSERLVNQEMEKSISRAGECFMRSQHFLWALSRHVRLATCCVCIISSSKVLEAGVQSSPNVPKWLSHKSQKAVHLERRSPPRTGPPPSNQTPQTNRTLQRRPRQLPNSPRRRPNPPAPRPRRRRRRGST